MSNKSGTYIGRNLKERVKISEESLKPRKDSEELFFLPRMKFRYQDIE
jgi:hypothetical protein